MGRQGTHTAPDHCDLAWEGRSAGEVTEQLGTRMRLVQQAEESGLCPPGGD